MKVVIDRSFDVFKEAKETPQEKKRNELSKLINSSPRFKRDFSVTTKTVKEKELLKKFKTRFKLKNVEN